jgi:hypothetical protein
MSAEHPGVHALWVMVILQAIKDYDDRREIATIEVDGKAKRLLKEDGTYLMVRDEAKEWVFSPNKDIGSMYWICATFGIDYHRMVGTCSTRSGRDRVLQTFDNWRGKPNYEDIPRRGEV